MKRSLNIQNIKNIDSSDMLGLLLDFPLQFKTSQSIANLTDILFKERRFHQIIFAGLGGSAIGADLVKSYLYFECNIPILVIREYDLPAYVDKSSLIFVSSYSGNTEETLSAYAQAKEKGAYIIAISSGGRLKESAQKDKITFIQIPPGLPPRCALGYLSIIPLCILAKLNIVKDVKTTIQQTQKVLEDLRDKNLHPRISQKDNLSKYVAAKLWNRFAVIYSSSIHFEVAATRVRSQLNENAKALASSHVFPEMNHNEIVGWQNPQKIFKNFVILILKDRNIHPRVVKKMDITKDILKKEGIDILEIWSRGEDLLSRIFSLIYIGDFISYYLAILYGIDPTPVDRVTYLKEKLS